MSKKRQNRKEIFFIDIGYVLGCCARLYYKYSSFDSRQKAGNQYYTCHFSEFH